MLLFLDIETTGFDLEKENILEIAAVRWNGEKIIDEFDIVLQLPAGKVINDEIIALTGITNEMCLEQGVDIEKAQEEFKKFLKDDDIITGHNIQFDTGFLKKFNFIDDSYQEIDTFLLSLLVLGQREQSHALEILSERFSLSHDNAHRAMSDVLANLDFYLALEKVYAQHFSASFKKFYNAENFIKNFPEKIFFEGVEEKIQNKTIKNIDFEFAKFPRPRKIAGLKELDEKYFNEIFENKKNVFIETINGQKYLEEVVFSAQKTTKKIAIFYPSHRKKEFFAITEEIEKSIQEQIHFDISRTQSVGRDNFIQFLNKPELERQEVIVASKIFRAGEMGDLPFVRFMGPEWKAAREVLGEENREEYTKNIVLLPYEEAPFVGDEYIKIFFGAEQLEETLLKMQTKKYFQKQLQEDLPEGPEKKEFISLLKILATGIRRVKGENKYAVRMLHKDLVRLPEYEEFTQGAKEIFANTTAKPLLLWRDFFTSNPNDKQIVQVVELFSDEMLSIEQIDPNFETSFEELLSKDQSNVFIGLSFPLLENKDLQWSFPLSKEKNFTLKLEKKNFPEKLIVPPFLRDATPKELAEYIQKYWNKGNVVVSVTSKRTTDGIVENLREEAEKEGIKIFTQQNGGSGKIMNMMKRVERKVVIGNAKFLDGLDISGENFKILVVHKGLFDHPKQPLIAAQRDRFFNDFNEYSMPRVCARLKKEFLRLVDSSDVILVFGDGRIAKDDTYHGRFREILGEDVI